MNDEHGIGSAPIEDRYKQQMVAVARAVDEFLNGPNAHPDNRKVGFVVMVFEFGSTAGRMNYISNASRDDVVIALREQLSCFDGMPDSQTGGRA